MNFSRLIWNELKKLKSSCITWIFIILAAMSPVLGFHYHPDILVSSGTANTLTILSPVKMGALLGAIFFAIFTIYEMDRIIRYNMLGFFEAYADMQRLNTAKVISIITAAVISVILAFILYLPYSMFKLSNLFNFLLYLKSYCFIMLPALVFSIMISAGFYMITRRMDISFLLYIGLVFISLNADKYLAVWIQTSVPAYTDCFENSFQINIILWNRLLWFLISIALLLLGIICTRRYEKNIFSSLLMNFLRPYLVFCTMAVLLMCYVFFRYEPYYDNTPDINQEMIANKDSKSAISISVLKKKDPDNSINMLKTFCDINIDVKNESIIGNASYYLENLEQKSKDMTIAINPGYNITSVKINGKSVSFKDTKETENNEKFIKIDLPEDKKLFMDIIYSGKIRQNRILQFKYTLSESNIISDDYISLAGCALIPSPIVHSGGSDGEENTISGHITLPANLKVIAAGSKAVKVSENSQKHLASWSFLGKEKEVVLAGKYECKEIDAGGINVEFYYSPKQKAVIDKIGAVQIIKESMDYFTDKYGKLGYSKDIPLNIVINAGVGGGNAIKNICNISEDTFEKDGFFNPSKIENGLNGNSVETLVHEICHQWWGINVKLPVEIQSSWSPEGITVYSTYKFLQYKYGAKYAYTADVKHWKEGLESLKRNFYYRNPSYMDVIPEKYLFNVLASLNSTRSYSLVPLQIYKAEQIVGEKKFESILAKLFRRYKANLSYDDFLRECGLAKEEISVE